MGGTSDGNKLWLAGKWTGIPRLEDPRDLLILLRFSVLEQFGERDGAGGRTRTDTED
jgi:hypothetical protein